MERVWLGAATLAVVAALAGCSDPSQTFDDADTAAGTVEPPVDAEPLPACRVDLDAELSRLGVPGLAASIVIGGEVACVSVAGLADTARDRPVLVDTPFTWASVSKTVTAVAVMQLIDDGELSLDDDVADHVDFGVRNPRCPSVPTTIRQLLAHTSSIIDDEDTYDASYSEGDSPIPLGEFVRDYLERGHPLS